MEEQNKKINWSLILLIVSISSGIAFNIDILVGFNNYTYWLSLGLSLLFGFIFKNDIYISSDKKSIRKPDFSILNKIKIWGYKMWSYLGFYLISMGIWSIFKISLEETQLIKSYNTVLYISIVLTAILMSVKGDKILYWWFRLQSITRLFEYKEHLINQNNVRLYIYCAYLVILFVNYSGLGDDTTQLWINTFATYVAFDRVRSNWHLLRNNEFSA